MARLAKGNREGFTEAREFYDNGGTYAGQTRTIQSLSTGAQQEFLGGAYSTTFLEYTDYYGDMDYADTWISAAFDGGETQFRSSTSHGSVDFGNFDYEGRAGEFGESIFCAYLMYHLTCVSIHPAAIRWGIPLLNVWMYVVGLLEKAAYNCNTTSDNANQIADWDKAVALYTGSEARKDGNGNTEGTGYFIYTLAQVECYKFGTCKKGELSPINKSIFEIFHDGKNNLSYGNCALVKNNALAIKQLMTVPLVQGVIRSMYTLDNQDDSQETTQGMAAAFAAAVLPLVYKCSEGSATAIHNDVAPGKAIRGSYEVVKAALERNYECLGIDCRDVGGLVNLHGEWYLKGAEACNNIKPVTSSIKYVPPSSSTSSYGNSAQSKSNAYTTANTSNNPSFYIILAVSFGVMTFVLGFILACICVKTKKTPKEVNIEKVAPVNIIPEEGTLNIDEEFVVPEKDIV